MRISIIGSPGSGKTFLAERISKELSIPHIHLDRFWFDAGGLDVSKKSSAGDREKIRSYVRQKTTDAIKGDSWVSDGLYITSVQTDIANKADIVLFLDIPLWRRLLNHVVRITKRSTRHEELHAWEEITFFFEIIRRTYANKAKITKFLTEFGGKVTTLKSRKEIDAYVEELIRASR